VLCLRVGSLFTSLPTDAEMPFAILVGGRTPTFVVLLFCLVLLKTGADLVLSGAMLPPKHVYSAVLHNAADSPMAIEVLYMTGSTGDQESKNLLLPAGQDVTLEQMTRDEGVPLIHPRSNVPQFPYPSLCLYPHKCARLLLLLARFLDEHLPHRAHSRPEHRAF